MTQTLSSPRTVADELRVIRKAIRRIMARPPSETQPALLVLHAMIEDAKARRL